MKSVRITGPARRDIANILRWSEEHVGTEARARYRALIDQAIQDVSEDPTRAGVRSIDDVRPGYAIYHLRFSRGRAGAALVRRPRHLIAFRMEKGDLLTIARLFHERQMLARHMRSPGGE